MIYWHCPACGEDKSEGDITFRSGLRSKPTIPYCGNCDTLCAERDTDDLHATIEAQKETIRLQKEQIEAKTRVLEHFSMEWGKIDAYQLSDDVTVTRYAPAQVGISVKTALEAQRVLNADWEKEQHP